MIGQRVSIACTVNGEQRTGSVEPRVLLSDWLRHDLGLTGTHVGCEHGVCGACTVLINNRAVRSCLTLAVQVDGCQVETVESLGTLETLSGFQAAMHDQHGLQCGFCTPGILMSVEGARRDREQLATVMDEVLGGHVCRCTGYQNIRAAIEEYWGQASVEMIV